MVCSRGKARSDHTSGCTAGPETYRDTTAHTLTYIQSHTNSGLYIQYFTVTINCAY